MLKVLLNSIFIIMRTIIPVVISVFLCLNCSEKLLVNPENTTPEEEMNFSDSLTYLALGDSYTIGQSVQYEERYPVQLVEELKSYEHVFKAPNIIARTGWTSSDLIQALNEKNPGFDYALVTLLIGVNNQFRGLPIEQYEQEFRTLLNQAIAYANGKIRRVLVISIPDYAFTPFGQSYRSPDQTSMEIDAHNEINRLIAESLGVKYVSVTAISRNGLMDNELVASDGLHPSGKMYQQWVKEILPLVLNILEP